MELNELVIIFNNTEKSKELRETKPLFHDTEKGCCSQTWTLFIRKSRENRYRSLWDLKRSRIWSHSITCSTRRQFPSLPKIWITLNIQWSEYLICALRIILENIHSGRLISAPFNLLHSTLAWIITFTVESLKKRKYEDTYKHTKCVHIYIWRNQDIIIEKRKK